jgi:spermidine/putrescine transport system permease protein
VGGADRARPAGDDRRDVEEAAADLGAPPREVLRRVLLPLLRRRSRRACSSSFALSIDDFVVAQYLSSGADTTTVPMRIYSQARNAPTPALNALATIMLVVSLLALALADFASGAARGAGGSARAAATIDAGGRSE